MKKIPLILILFSFVISAQRSEIPWNNGDGYKKNYKVDVAKTLKTKNISDYFTKQNQNFKIPAQKTTKTLSINPVVNGINIAWVNFGRDVGVDPFSGGNYRPDLTKFSEVMDFVVQNGGNIVRWWYHTNGSTNPAFSNQKVIQNPQFFHDDVLEILDLAESKGLKVQICLWSFDMLKDQWGVDAAANKKLLTEETFTTAYINNALTPLVNAIGNHPGLYAWEIFNEPEGMTTEYAGHWEGFLQKVEMPVIQTFINKTAGAIRRAQPNVKITNGALGLLTNMEDSNKGFWNAYTNVNLTNAGGDQDGYLDFYNIHYYKWAKVAGSPFHNPFDSGKIDKATVVGEYYPDDLILSGVPAINTKDLGTKLMDNSWAGSLVWSWTDRSSSRDKTNMASIISSISNHSSGGDGSDDQNTTLEAELANLSGSTSIKNNTSASSGKYVQLGSSPSTITFAINNVPSNGNYKLTITHRSFNGNSSYGNKNQYVKSSASNNAVDFLFSASNDWREDSLDLYLNEGDNTITIIAHWGYTDIDHVSINLPSTTTNNNGLIKDGTYYLKSSVNSQRLIAPKWASYNTQMNNPGNYNDQRWVFKHLGNNVYTILNKGTKRYLQVKNGECNNKVNVYSSLSASGENTKWKIIYRGDETYSLKPMSCLSRALDRDGGATNANIHLWNYINTNNNQKWKIQFYNNENKIFNQKSNTDLKIYPNPTVSNLKIEGLEIGSNIFIYDLLGRKILNRKTNTETENLDVSNLKPGYYNISVLGKKKKIFLKK
ncbi:RICIN domain-containing protein [Aquimarina latercula]|uniref:RICIN domain-containing protein n=1 Tax=Aquimarina latercula TaxID=987 RepID=UPI0004032766|nr:RICIN domain-containing protein [Aquimarina latercula]